MILEDKSNNNQFIKYTVNPEGRCITTCPNGKDAAVGSINCYGCEYNQSIYISAIKEKTIECSCRNKSLHQHFVELIDDITLTHDLHKNFLYQQYLDNRFRL